MITASDNCPGKWQKIKMSSLIMLRSDMITRLLGGHGDLKYIYWLQITWNQKTQEKEEEKSYCTE